MTDWEQLIIESQRLNERASKIQDGEKIGLTKDEIGKLANDYYSWFAKCLSVLPEDLKSGFRDAYEGGFWNAKIKRFFASATEPSMLHQAAQENTKAAFPYWNYPYNQNFYPHLLTQQQLLIEASERQEPSNVEGEWNTTVRRVFKKFVEKANEAKTNNAKKLSYEYLAIFLITAIDGLTVIGHDTRGVSEETDLWVENNSSDSFWQKMEHIFRIECKNWSEPIGVQEVRNLSSIMENKNIKFAILLSRNGITGDIQHDAVAVIRDDFKKGRHIIVLDQNDLEEIADGIHPTMKIREKYRELVMKS